MKSVNIKLTGTENLENSIVYIDDNIVEFKKNEFKNLTYNYQTEKDKINIRIYKHLDVGGIWWFITQLFFFVVSIFGIFDVHTKNKYMAMQFETEIELEENNDITFRYNTPKNNQKAFEVETNLKTTEKCNNFFVDEKAKKIFRNLLISKIILALSIIAIIIVVLVF